MKPLGNFVILKPVEKEVKTGIIMPDSVDKQLSERGEVVAKGDECIQKIEVGEVVMFRKYSPDIIKDGEQEYLILPETEIMAVI